VAERIAAVAEPVPVTTWIAAVSFARQAGDVARRGTAVDRVTAMILADTAIEAGLGIIVALAA
jgi:hypothetical protein